MMKKNSGNVLFIILLAVALFAGLSYAVVQSGRSNSDVITREQAKIFANEMLAYAAQVQNSVTRLKTMKGCKIEQISFYDATYFPDHINTNAPSDEHCHVFSSSGGRVPIIAPPIAARDASQLTGTAHWNKTNLYVFNNRNAVKNIGSDNAESLLFVTFLNDAVCTEINHRKNILKSTRNNVDFSSYSSIFTVVETFGNAAGDLDLAGKEYGCVIEPGSSPTAGNHFFYVLDQR